MRIRPLAPLLLAALVVAGCGADGPSVPVGAIAVVGKEPIERSQLGALMAEARQSYAARDRAFPVEGSSAYAALTRMAVRLLVEQAVAEQEAPKLGVEVDRAAVDARLARVKDESFGDSERRYEAKLRAAGMTDAQLRGMLRAQLLTAAVRQAVIANVTVSNDVVEHWYETHLRDYSTPGRPPVTTPLARVRDAIHSQLLAAARAKAFRGWVRQAEARYARRTAYASGFAPGAH